MAPALACAALGGAAAFDERSGTDHRRIEYFYPVTPEILGIEGEDVPYPVHVHGSYQARIVNLDSLQAVFDDQTLPFRIGRRRVRQQRQDTLDFFDFASTSETGKSSPLFAKGRVATFQNSEMFCGVKQTGSPLASNRATLFIETACCGWEG
jgi:hypothetical protein